jgi:hypothetical protein
LLKLAVLSAILASLLLSAQTFLMNEAPVPEIIQRLCAYEKRLKRKNFLEKLSALS